VRRRPAQANLSYNGSFYDNRDSSLTLAQLPEQLGWCRSRTPASRSRPDNEWHNFRADAP
jgi:hypothetical protein